MYNFRPNIGGDPVTVGVSLDLLAIHEVSAKNMDFTVDINLKQSWNDSRLAFAGNEAVTEIVFGVEKMKEIWMPDTFFRNQKSSLYKGPASDSDSFMSISLDGMILVSRRITLTAGCPMDLSAYPMDTQECSLDLGSYSHTVSDIRYMWRDGNKSRHLSHQISIPNYYVLGFRQMEAPTPNYSGLIVFIKLARTSLHSIKYLFIPAALLVALSWLTFLLSPEQLLARLSLCLTPLLALLYLVMQDSQDIPPLPYCTAVDIYLYSCCTAVTAAMVITTLTSCSGRRGGYGKVEVGEDGQELETGKRDVQGKAKCILIVIMNHIYFIRRPVLE